MFLSGKKPKHVQPKESKDRKKKPRTLLESQSHNSKNHDTHSKKTKLGSNLKRIRTSSRRC